MFEKKMPLAALRASKSTMVKKKKKKEEIKSERRPSLKITKKLMVRPLPPLLANYTSVVLLTWKTFSATKLFSLPRLIIVNPECAKYFHSV